MADVEETEASLKGEDVLRQFCEAQRKDLMQADVTALTEMLATILPEVDKKTCQYKLAEEVLTELLQLVPIN